MKAKFDELSDLFSKSVTQHYSTSFSFGIRLFATEIREPIYAIYGFVRLADEIVDSFHNYPKSYLLQKFRQDCFEAIEQRISLNPALNSFQKAVHDYHIDLNLIDLFLKSMEMDLQKQVFTAPLYEKYILGSAQVVGLMCLHVFTNGDRAAFDRLEPAAMSLGAAFQKVNFLRDLKADYIQLGRTYFPEISIEQLSINQKQQIENEIEHDFQKAKEGISALPSSSRKGVWLAFIYYYRLFQKIRKLKLEEVLSERVRISNARKGILMLNTLIRYKLNAL